MPLLDVIVGYDCNLACDYCTITTEMRERSLDARQSVRELRRGAADGYDAVSFTGGEPTLRRELLALVREAKRLGYEDIKVQSNGLLLGEPRNLERLIAAGVSRVHVSIHTHEEAAYEKLVRRAGTFAMMEAAVKGLVAAPVVFNADLILKADTIPKLPDAIDWLGAKGVASAQLWYVSLTDANAGNIESMPPMTSALAQVFEAFRRAELHGMALHSLHIPRCLLGEFADRARDPGNADVRVVTPEATFELRDSAITPQRQVPACEGCEHQGYCPGLRPDYLEVYGDAEVAAARGQSPSMSPRRGLPLIP